LEYKKYSFGTKYEITQKINISTKRATLLLFTQVSVERGFSDGKAGTVEKS
jgi:hypothetical protein